MALWVGLHTSYNGRYRGLPKRELEPIPIKAGRSPDCSLQLDCMKSESLVIADQHVAVNTFRVLYTPPVTPWERDVPEV